MEWMQRLNQSIEYIEQHITEELDYEKVAEVAGCPSYYFQQMFLYMTDMTLREYIRRRRLSLAAVEDAECGVFVYAGIVPNTQIYTELKLDNGYIPVDELMQTEIPGVFAAGDICVKKVRQVATAVADGAIAGIQAAVMC